MSARDPFNLSTLEVEALLARRTEGLCHRPGLCDRVQAAVEREVMAMQSADGAQVLAVIGAPRWRRSLAFAAGVMLACGTLATLVLHGGHAASMRHRTVDGLSVTMAMASSSRAEQMLLALSGAKVAPGGVEASSIIEEILPAGAMRLGDLDAEMRALLAEAPRSSEASR